MMYIVTTNKPKQTEWVGYVSSFFCAITDIYYFISVWLIFNPDNLINYD